ncbi:MAG: hypothetical protein ACR2JE_16045 [Acidobacteriaceae bacterium]
MRPDLLRDPRWALVLRVASSQHFKTSPRLCDFLLYVADCAIRDAPEDATEQQIGMHVFQRAAGYNSSEDSIVRSHARILRQKLSAYFAVEGAGEKLRIDVPKGHYLLVFSSAPSATELQASAPGDLVTVLSPAHVPPPDIPVDRSSWVRRHRVASVLGFILILAAAIAAAALVRSRVASQSVAKSSVDTLWAPFLGHEAPIVIYSNAVFVGDSKSGMRYPTPLEQQEAGTATHSIDHYTGIGELAGVYELTKLFDSRKASFILKRSRLVTWDEAKLKDLILIGSTAENLSLRDLPVPPDFGMMSNPEESGYVNKHPKPGEPDLYSRPEKPLTRDYAVVAFLPGVQPGKKMMILSGLTTLGTQAAVEYASHPETAAELLRAATDAKKQVRPFEALLETRIVGGVPLETRLVTIRLH